MILGRIFSRITRCLSKSTHVYIEKIKYNKYNRKDNVLKQKLNYILISFAFIFVVKYKIE